MQSYVLNLAQGAVRPFDVPADLFVYESGAPTPPTGDTRIKVKPNTGAEIVLRPGQRFRLAPNSNATHWEVSALDPSVALSGYVIIGSGEFDDANTLNTFKLDATFANNVKVINSIAERVPVTLDLAQRMPVALDPSAVINVAGSTVQYTNAYNNNSTAAIVADPIFTAAQNPNGAFLEFVDVAITATNSGAAYASMTLIAKATAPTSETDGDGVFTATTGLTGTQGPIPINITQNTRIKIAAGKGLYLNQTNVSGGAVVFRKLVLVTLL